MVYRIEIAGGIAVGKSSLCAALRQAGYEIISENLAETPFLGRDYADKGARGFDLGMSFLLSKASGIETYNGPAEAVIVDYALIAEYAYNDVHLREADARAHALVQQAIDFRRAKLGEPDLLIHLHSPVAHQMANIKKRGRDFEQGHSAAYVQSINDRIGHWIAGRLAASCPVLSVDTQKTDVAAPAFVAQLTQAIEAGKAAKRQAQKPAAPQAPRP
jgi:deoxyadenosine/deoxycytidine kinase